LQDFQNNLNNELFSNAPGPRTVDRGWSGGALWTHGGAGRGHGGALTGAWPPAAPVHQSSPDGPQNGEGWSGRLTSALMALTPLKMGRLDERLRSAIKEGNQSVG
jgi:hypothetical protein